MNEKTVRELLAEIGNIKTSLHRIENLLRSALLSAPDASGLLRFPLSERAGRGEGADPATAAQGGTVTFTGSRADNTDERGDGGDIAERPALAPGNGLHETSGGPGAAGDRQGPTGGLLGILDLSADIKKVHLALLRLGKASIEQLQSETGMERDELRTYLRTLEREGSVTRDSGKNAGGSTYRAVMRRSRRKGVSNLLDKLG